MPQAAWPAARKARQGARGVRRRDAGVGARQPQTQRGSPDGRHAPRAPAVLPVPSLHPFLHALSASPATAHNEPLHPRATHVRAPPSQPRQQARALRQPAAASARAACRRARPDRQCGQLQRAGLPQPAGAELGRLLPVRRQRAGGRSRSRASRPASSRSGAACAVPPRRPGKPSSGARRARVRRAHRLRRRLAVGNRGAAGEARRQPARRVGRGQSAGGALRRRGPCRHGGAVRRLHASRRAR